jgi:cytochrome oxidase assembly protein ShyY1
MPRPPNNHFQYAMTWFALAVALGVIYGIHVRRVLRA